MTAIDFQAVFAALPSPYMLLDHELRYVAANGAYLETTSRTLDELLGVYVMDAFPNPGEEGRRLRESFEKVLATGESDTLAYLPYPIRQPDGSFIDRYWTCVHTPLLASDGSVAFVMQNTVDVTEYAHMRQAATLPFRTVVREASLIERTQEAEEARQALLAESADFRRLFQQAPGFFAILSGPDHVFTFASDSYTRLIGGRAVVGLPILQALPEVAEQGFVDLLDQVLASGRPHQEYGSRVMLQGAQGEPMRETFLDFSYSPIRGREGRITGVFVQGTDQTESILVQRRQRLLLDELNHRVKNALATVQSIAAQTFRSTPDVNLARKAFEARLIALAATHSMLSRRQWEDAEFGALVRQELDAYGPDRADVAGPYVVVSSKAAISLSLVLHELTTNAAKYGAFSSEAGRLKVRWRVEMGRDLYLTWEERGGPSARVPETRGFGSRLITGVVEGELAGNLDVTFGPPGLTVKVRVPASTYLSAIPEY
jgi:two-component sensor histidine kinase